MNVALTPQFETCIRQLIGTGRYDNASEVVRAALRDLREKEGEVFPPGSLSLSSRIHDQVRQAASR